MEIVFHQEQAVARRGQGVEVIRFLPVHRGHRQGHGRFAEPGVHRGLEVRHELHELGFDGRRKPLEIEVHPVAARVRHHVDKILYGRGTVRGRSQQRFDDRGGKGRRHQHDLHALGLGRGRDFIHRGLAPVPRIAKGPVAVQPDAEIRQVGQQFHLQRDVADLPVRQIPEHDQVAVVFRTVARFEGDGRVELPGEVEEPVPLETHNGTGRVTGFGGRRGGCQARDGRDGNDD